MDYLLKIFIFFSFLICAKQIVAQVTGVQYAIVHDSDRDLFDCFLYINEGSASSTIERVQFNAQYSLVVPTGVVVNIMSSHMPLIDNQNFKGTQSIDWTISSKISSPDILPEMDFYGITPNLTPTGFYNKLSEGDLVKLFTVKVEAEDLDLKQVRIFDNDSDPKSRALGMQNGDFSNGFTMGGYHQIYNGIKIINQEEAF